ncbi:MAG: cold shock domain-containing protein [Bacteroidales bacterium]|nr:cold shock domain-containing protein [Bacteroidales bacterium]MCF8387755.1 cold shock domain-containing protein [Bacteroidales bacterium]MCF8397165.1 cold shock domain-containing protein [Bacteroidales bacterium]
MGRSQETFNKKEVRKQKEKKRKEKEKKRQARKEEDKKGMDDMIAYVDEYGNITDTPPDPEEKDEVKAEDITIGAANRNTAEDLDPVKKGTVTFFNDAKGFGFIREAESKQDVFVHINNVDGDIKEGMLMSFEVENGPKGPAAVRVKAIK